MPQKFQKEGVNGGVGLVTTPWSKSELDAIFFFICEMKKGNNEVCTICDR